MAIPGKSSRMSDQLSDIWQDPAEAIGSMLLESSLDKALPALAQVPLLSIAIATYKSRGAVADYLLARKVQQFYTAWDELPQSKRRNVYEKFQKKPKDFIEKLLLIVERQEDFDKCRIIGVLTTAYLGGGLKRAEYFDFLETISHLSFGDLMRLVGLAPKGLIFSEREVGERYAVLFVTRGLMTTEQPLPEEQRIEEPYTFYKVTPAGRKLADYVGTQA